MRGRLITETIERLQNTPNLSPLAIKLLKTIGLVNWLAEVSNLQPTRQTLVTALRTPTTTAADIEAALEMLLAHSLIVFRRFNGSYVIWQGSDVDLDERLQTAQRKLQGVFRLAHTVEQYMPPRPVVARRHSYRTGFLRFWQMRYIDAPDRESMHRAARTEFAGVILLCLPVTQADHEAFLQWVGADWWRESPDFVIGIAQDTTRMAQLAYDLRGLH